ncbi:hypothetical protein KY285_024037 [Solanum tuberosum]|nr:hypothetical protein KY289_024390 [Solanum tuberosum]KAH0676236.1 hypothetical protein KY285_024037 [Solanum tuberosum]
MTPIVEEIASFIGKGPSVRSAELCNKKLIFQRTEGEFEKWVGLIGLSILYERYCQKDGFKNYRNQLSNQGGEEAWKANGCFAFMVAFLGLIVFPKWDKHIDIRLTGVVKALTTIESPTIIPMILAYMFRALTKCINGEMYFEGCNILLQIWFLEQLYHHDRTPAKDVICMSNGISFLVLIGLRGIQPYAPLWVMCQLARVQEIPPNDDMSRFVFDTPPDKGRVVPGYLSWFRDPVTFGDVPEGSSRKRKDQHIIRQLEKELEKAKATIVQQEVHVQRGKNHQLEDLVAFEELVHYQKGELKRQKEKFEKERSCWMHLHDQLKAQLEEHKRKISYCVDIKEGERQMIIERATLRHQLEAAEEREALLRNNLGDHQFWLNNCHENMGRARRQVHQLAKQTSYVIKNHHRMNDSEVAVQARAIVPHLPKVLLNLYETLGGQRKPQEDDED